MLTDLAVDDEGRITGRSQHCARIALSLLSPNPPEVTLEYTPADPRCAVEARAIAQNFADSMATGGFDGFGGLYNRYNPGPPCLQWPQGCWGPPERPRECVEWPKGGRPRRVPC